MQTWLAVPQKIYGRFGGKSRRFSLAQRALINWAKVDDYHAILDLNCQDANLLMHYKHRFNIRACGVLPMYWNDGHIKADGAMDEVELMKAHLNDLPWQNDSFDTVFSGFKMNNALYIPGVLNEILRVLKPGGQFVCNQTGFFFRYRFSARNSKLTDNGQSTNPYALMETLVQQGFSDVSMRFDRFGSLTILSYKGESN